MNILLSPRKSQYATTLHVERTHTPILAHAVANADACAEAAGERAERVQRDRVHEECALDEVGGGGRVVADAHDVRELEQRVRVVEAGALVEGLREWHAHAHEPNV